MASPRGQRALLELLSDGSFHSGTVLARHFGVSRAAVWAAIRDLVDAGLDIAAVSGKGYRLHHPIELLARETIGAALSPQAAELCAAIEIHDRIESTNSYLLGRAAAAPSGTVCTAESQTGGRGRLGRTWSSPFGGNLYVSVLWRFADPSMLSGLSLAAGVAVVQALADLGVDGVTLKWPNDVLWQERKLGGLLLEVTGEANGGCVVVLGLGLNVRMPERAAAGIDQPWVDLDRLTGGSPPSRNRLLAGLLNRLLPMLEGFGPATLPSWLEAWRAVHAFEGRQVCLQQGDRVVLGRVVGISPIGLLILEDGDGRRAEFASGDVSLRLAAPGMNA